MTSPSQVRDHLVSDANPPQQGLKPDDYEELDDLADVSDANPPQQGLKQFRK